MTSTLSINRWSITLLRISLSGIFIIAGISHFVEPNKVAERINNANFSGFALFFGDPYWLGILSGFALLIGGAALLFGFYTKWASLLLLILLLPITITIQMGNGLLHGPLWKNIALAGGLCFFIINQTEKPTKRTLKKILLK